MIFPQTTLGCKGSGGVGRTQCEARNPPPFLFSGAANGSGHPQKGKEKHPVANSNIERYNDFGYFFSQVTWGPRSPLASPRPLPDLSQTPPRPPRCLPDASNNDSTARIPQLGSHSKRCLGSRAGYFIRCSFISPGKLNLLVRTIESTCEL